MIVCAFFSPTLKRALLTENIHVFVRRQVAAWRFISVLCHGAETVRDSVDLELQRFSLEPPLPLEKDAVTMKEYLAWWTTVSPSFQRIATLITAILQLTPTESTVERVFSKLKFSVTKSRTLLEAKHALNQVTINSAIELLDSNNIPPDTEADKRISNQTLEEVVLLGTHKFEEVAVRRKRTRKDDELCDMCQRSQADHEPQPWVQCSTCQGWYGFLCVGLAPHLKSLVESMPSWECPKCRGHL